MRTKGLLANLERESWQNAEMLNFLTKLEPDSEGITRFSRDEFVLRLRHRLGDRGSADSDTAVGALAKDRVDAEVVAKTARVILARATSRGLIRREDRHSLNDYYVVAPESTI